MPTLNLVCGFGNSVYYETFNLKTMNIKKTDLLKKLNELYEWSKDGLKNEDNYELQILYNNYWERIIVSTPGDDFFIDNEPEDCSILAFVHRNDNFDKIIQEIEREGHSVL